MKALASALVGLCLMAFSGAIFALESVARTVPPANDLGTLLTFHYTQTTGLSGMQSFKTRYGFFILDPSPWSTRFIATQFGINGDALYIGVNPPNDRFGYAGEAHFSYFGNRGGRPLSANCHSDADGGSGITCALPGLRAKQGYNYELEAKIVQATSAGAVLEGYVTEFEGSTGNAVGTYQIGRFELNIPGASISDPVTWIEGGADPCPDVTRTRIAFSPLFINSDYSEASTAYIASIDRAKCGATVWPSDPSAYYVFVDYGY